MLVLRVDYRQGPARDNPVSPEHFAQSFVRMYKIATTPPYGPVMMALDGGLQTEPINIRQQRTTVRDPASLARRLAVERPASWGRIRCNFSTGTG